MVVYHTRPHRCPALIPPTEGLCALVSLVGSIVGLYGVGAVAGWRLVIVAKGVHGKARKFYDYKTESNLPILHTYLKWCEYAY